MLLSFIWSIWFCCCFCGGWPGNLPSTNYQHLSCQVSEPIWNAAKLLSIIRTDLELCDSFFERAKSF